MAKSLTFEKISRDVCCKLLHWNQTILFEIQKNAPKISLPVPDVRKVEDYEQEHSPNFQLPQQYIHHKPRIYNEGFDAVDYVADDQDWVR